VYYVALSSTGMFAGSGYYRMAKDQIDRFRRAVAADGGPGDELAAIVAALEAGGHEVGGEALKTAPRGYPADHPRIRLLRHKGVTAGRSWEPAPWMGTAKAAGRVIDVWRAAGRLNAWLVQHVGSSSEPS
jgi:uncharacterized protein (DUF2461 family)